MDREFLHYLKDKKEVSLRYDAYTEAVWVYGKPEKCPCLNISMLQELHETQTGLIDYFRHHDMKPKTPVKFFVYASQIPDIFSLGGDVETIYSVAKNQKREKMEQCAKLAIKAMHLNFTNFGLPIHTLALVEGDAMGGGFEKALSFGKIIAEEQSRFGLQQMRFNMLPGSGIYSFLVRMVGPRYADEIITQTKIYSAQEMHEMGAVSVVARKGEGKKEVDRYLRQYKKSFRAMQALEKAKLRYAPFPFSELEYMAELFVNTIMGLDRLDLKMLQKLAESQEKNTAEISHRLRTKQDRRFVHPDPHGPIVDAAGNPVAKDRRKNPDPRTSHGTS